MNETSQIYDLAVIGGGPAGMMAAGRAAEVAKAAGKTDFRVVLLEKNDGLGKKLLITGGGRCNVTNAQYNVREFLKKYKDSDKFLFSAFSQMDVRGALEFFNTRGMPTKVEAENRVFPVSDSARSVWEVLVEYMREGGVEVKTGAVVMGFEHRASADQKELETITAIKLKGGKKIMAHNYVIATGGTSRPETGSTGEGFLWLKNLRHKVVPSTEALVPVALKDSWVKKLSGISLKDVKLTTFQNGQKQQMLKGKMLFTHFGISGPVVLNMSKDIGELLKYGEVEIRLDLLPAFGHDVMNAKLQELFKVADKKKTKNSLDELIPAALVGVVLDQAGIDPEKNCNSVTREERIKLIDTIKGIRMNVSSLLGSDKAIVSSGGVDLTEVDFKTMKSKVVDNLYLVGDVLNIDRPSGGYSLQLCWTTGWVAGSNAVK